MNKSEIIDLLEESHDELFAWIEQYGKLSWVKGPGGKWTTGQQIKHLVQSLDQLNLALKIPRFILKSRFGISNRTTREYAEVVDRYKERLASNPDVIAPAAVGMEIPSVESMANLVLKLRKGKDQIVNKVRSWKESDLDKYVLPHPLMGKMPIREIVMWTGYHTKHHTGQLVENYTNL